ncbi:MAG: hypothetical protein OEZ04_01525 [Nitrospinota bacterium]|nr:hypothetical protein [Nitrospinota bacterium]
MKKTIPFQVALALMVFIPATALAQEARSTPWLVAITSNSSSWSASGLDSEGVQNVQYAQLSRREQGWGVAVTGKYVNTSYTNQTGGGKLEISSPTKTSIASYLNYERGAMTLRGGVDLDLPTGKNSYSDIEVEQLITDPLSEDLMMINTYGEGSNVIPHALVAYAFTKAFSVGVGMKYEMTGKYDITVDTEGDELDPGDRILAMANAALKLSDERYLILTASYASATEDKQKDAPVYRQGEITAFELRGMNTFNSGLTLIASAAVKSQGKNQTLGEGNQLAPELVNSNNNSWQVFAAGTYPVTGKIKAAAVAGYKVVSANGYEEGHPLQDAGRTAMFIEPGAKWSPKESMYVTLKGRYTAISDNKDTFSKEDASYTVTNLDLGLAWAF